MITIEFIHSPDQDIITRFDFLFDRIALSQKAPADLIIADPDFPHQPIGLRMEADRLVLLPDDTPYLHNGKKMLGVRRLSQNDEITIGKTSFRILSFSTTEQSYEQRLRQKFQEINQSSPDIAVILDLLEEELLHLQVEENKKK